MVDAESAVARVCGHLVDTARRPGPGESPARPDDALRALHDVMRGALHDTPAWLRAVEQAEEGEVPARTRRRLVQAVEDAAGRDASFARQLRAALAALPPARPGGQAGAEGSVAVSGDAVVQARDGGVAALSIGDVTLHPAPRGRAENEGVVAVGGIAVGGVIAVGSNSHASHV
ncbi:MAG: hypothetical protein HOY69_33275, partial [Streptomyces sp.]|nr:hypothetical protein [Streptomyces sp.]